MDAITDLNDQQLNARLAIAMDYKRDLTEELRKLNELIISIEQAIQNKRTEK